MAINLVKAMMTFLEVMKEQSMTKAAQKLFLTPTAVSKQLKQLEEKLGQPLIKRTTRKMEVTELGARFYQHCVDLSLNLEQTEAFIEGYKLEPQGVLKIICSFYFSSLFPPEYYFEFQKKYPLIKLNIEISDRHPDLGQESFDLLLGFRHLGKITSQLKQRKLEESCFVLCAAPSYLKKHGEPKAPKDLEKHELINHPARDPDNLIKFKNGTEIFMPSPKIIINNMEVLIKLGLAGAGILILTQRDAEKYLTSGKLIQLLAKYPLENFIVYGFYQASHYEPVNRRLFLDFVLEKLKK